MTNFRPTLKSGNSEYELTTVMKGRLNKYGAAFLNCGRGGESWPGGEWNGARAFRQR